MDTPVTICFVHGVTTARFGFEPAWGSILDETLALNGFERPSAHGIQFVTVDYRDVFEQPPNDEGMPDRTDGTLTEEQRANLQSEYSVRQQAVLSAISEYFAVVPGPRLDTIPETQAEHAAELASLMWSPLRAQANAYSNDPKLREAIIRRVRAQLPKRGHIVIIAHSLGSVVALDLIPRLPRGVTVSLITIGSPLSIKSNWEHVEFSGQNFPADRMRMWVNVFDAIDPVTVGRGVSERFNEATDVQVSFASLAQLASTHASRYYLSLPVVGAAVAEAVFAGRSRPRDRVSAKTSQFDDGWNPQFLASAYATEIARTTESIKFAWRADFDAARHISAERIIETVRAHQHVLPPELHEIPTTTDLLDNAAALVNGVWDDEELVPLAIAMMMASPVQPFSFKIEPEQSLAALTNTLDRVRGTGSPERTSQEFATALTDALTEATSAILPVAQLFRASLDIAGATFLAASDVAPSDDSPHGLTGARQLAEVLRLVEPGGMIGGMVTLALGSNVGSALLTTNGSKDAALFVHLLSRLPIEQLEASLIGYMAVLAAQDRLGFEDSSDEMRAMFQSLLVDVSNEYNAHEQINSLGKAEWARKHDVVERALKWVDRKFPPAMVDVVRHALTRKSELTAPDLKAIEARIKSDLRRALRPDTGGTGELD